MEDFSNDGIDDLVVGNQDSDAIDEIMGYNHTHSNA